VAKFQFVRNVLTHLKQSLSEDDGTGSYARIMGAIIAFSTIVWVTWIVGATHTLPNLTDCGIFIASGSSAYAVNKAQGIVSAFKGNPNGPQKEVPAPEGSTENKGA
jgi:hypothetical protein